MHNETKSTKIPKNVRDTVYERDEHICIICGRYIPYDEDTDTYIGGGPFAHYIRRSHGGLGIEQNVVNLCNQCHYDYDNGLRRKENGKIIHDYLELNYPGFPDGKRVYSKFDWLYKERK